MKSTGALFVWLRQQQDSCIIPIMPTLNFKGKTAIESYHLTVPHHILDFDKKLSLRLRSGQALTKSPSLDGNLIIEGDNLLALKSLLPTHGGKVKCTYIDPPYNTGNEGWVFNDNLTQPQFKEWIGRVVGKEGEDATRHDKWCCMMYPRLQLLRELLRDDGAIFISIDDNEVQHLRMMMDEIFGEENFIATIIWQKVYAPKSSAKFFSENHDYIILYAKQRDEWERYLLPRGEYPSYEELARYIFYTETSQAFDPKGMNAKTSKIGEYKGRSYYLLYTPDGKADMALTKEWLQDISKHDKNAKVIDCEKIWLHRDDLAAFGNVRAMLIPVNLK